MGTKNLWVYINCVGLNDINNLVCSGYKGFLCQFEAAFLDLYIIRYGYQVEGFSSVEFVQ